MSNFNPDFEPKSKSGRRPNKPKSAIGLRLKEIIGDENYSAFELRIGVARGTISKYMRGVTPSSRTIALISEATGCNPTWLLTGQGEPFLESTPGIDESTYSTDQDESSIVKMTSNQVGRKPITEKDKPPSTGGHVPGGSRIELEGEDFVLPDSCKVIGFAGDSQLIDIGINSLIIDHDDPPKSGDLVWCLVKEGSGKGHYFRRVFFNDDERTLTLTEVDVKGGAPPLVKGLHQVELFKVVAVWLK